jgi:1-acyl-sn-glycerol-3-phosphate acyltransferase
VRPPDEVRSPGLLKLFRRWVRREIRWKLDGLRVAGLPAARDATRSAPVVLAANHVAFWDVFLVLALDEALGTEGYALMDAENLCRVPFFGRLGAIPMRRGAPRAGLRAAARLLDRPGRAVWIFPQGEHRPPHLRPLRFLPGVRALARLAPGAVVLPIGFQYAFAESQGPVCYASLGPPIPASAAAAADGAELVARGVERELDRIDGYLERKDGDFEPLIPSRDWRDRMGTGTRLLNALVARRPGRR